MEDKTFELMTQMYVEFSSFKKDITKKVDILTEKTEEFKEDITKKVDDIALKTAENSYHILRLEHEFNNKTEALFDGYNQVYNKLECVEGKIDNIERKLEKQDVEIKVIKGRRKKAQ